jgi:hypothetical protein
MISAQTLRVCREGEPLHTIPHHALRHPADLLTTAIDRPAVGNEFGYSGAVEMGDRTADGLKRPGDPGGTDLTFRYPRPRTRKPTPNPKQHQNQYLAGGPLISAFRKSARPKMVRI